MEEESGQFGPYRLGRLIGRGGFGEVYEAVDTRMNRRVALKLIAPTFARDETFRERLLREAQAAGRLHDPHVVPIHACGEIGGRLYIDMRLIDGTDLAALLRSGPLDPARAVAVISHIAAALDAAQAEGIVHRDVKPANILLDRADFAYLVDFGVAGAAGDTKLTSMGTTVGTLAYMSPERFGDTTATAAADEYALTCVLYECLTGATPFSGDLPAMVGAHLSAPIPQPSRMVPELPPAFDEVIATGMAKNPADRYPSAGALARAAQRALNSGTGAAAASTGYPPQIQNPFTPSTSAAPPPVSQIGWQQVAEPASVAVSAPTAPKRNRTPMFIGLAAVAAVAALAVGLVFWPTGSPSTKNTGEQSVSVFPSPVVESSGSVGTDNITESSFTGLVGQPMDVAAGRDGAVYVTDTSNNRILWLAPGSSTPEALPFPGLNLPKEVDVDDAGTVYVINHAGAGLSMLRAGAPGSEPVPDLGTVKPTSVAVAPDGLVYVADYGHQRVWRLGANPGDVIVSGLNHPRSMAADGNGNLYIVDVDLDDEPDTYRVLKVDGSGGNPIVLPFGDVTEIGGVAVDSAGTVYITDRMVETGPRLLKLPAGSSEPIVIALGKGKDALGLAVDPEGNVYLADYSNDPVYKVTP